MTYDYACLTRPPQPGSIPREGLVEAMSMYGEAPSWHPSWGWATYRRRLTKDEEQQYDLESLPGGWITTED